MSRIAGRIIAYSWALPTTCVGLLLATAGLLTGARAKVVAGVLEVHGGAVTLFLRYLTLLPGGAAAMTLGHVVLGVDRTALEFSREHERVHVCQVERWGPLFIPAYLIASCVAWLRGGSAYRDNVFEKEAYGTTSRANP